MGRRIVASNRRAERDWDRFDYANASWFMLLYDNQTCPVFLSVKTATDVRAERQSLADAKMIP